MGDICSSVLMQREFFPLPLSPWKPQLHCWLSPFPPHAFQINIGAWLPTGCPHQMGAALRARGKPGAWGVVTGRDGEGVQGSLASLLTHSPRLISLESLPPPTPQRTFGAFTGSPPESGPLQGETRQVTSGHLLSLLRRDTERWWWWGAVVLFKSWTEFLPAPGRTKAGQRQPKQKQVPARLQPSPKRGTALRRELAQGLLRINLLL